MNETYPNISVNGVRLSSDSSSWGTSIDQKYRKSTGVRARARQRLVVSELVRIVSTQGQWNVLVYELSATVIHLVARHAFVADISVWFAGKSYHGKRGKNRSATTDEFSRPEIPLSLVTHRENENIGKKKERFPTTISYNMENCICTV